MILVCMNLFALSHFWTTHAKFVNCCQRYIAMCVKKFIYVHIYVLGHKLQLGNYIQISQLCIQNGAYKLFCRFLYFSQFSTAISRKLWRHLAMKIGSL